VPKARLTDIAVRALKPTETHVTTWDTVTPGFGIRTGLRSKTWTVMRGHTRERITIGRYPDMSLAEARTEAKKILSTVSVGAKPPSLTFREARDEFLRENYREAKPITLKQMTWQLTRHFRAFDAQKLGKITDVDIKRELDKFSSTPSNQLHAYRALRTMMLWCKRPPRRYITSTPLEGYEPPAKDRKRTRILTDKELRAVWVATDGATRRVFRLMLLWGTRNGETCAIRRSWVQDDTLTIPASHAKNGKAHIISLLPMARDILDSIPDTGDFYFPGQRHDHINPGSIKKLHGDVKRDSGTSGWTPHDLRRTARSTWSRLRIPVEVCEALLNHSPPRLLQIYDQWDYLPEKREALEKWEAFLHTLLAQA
jgi:integrase